MCSTPSRSSARPTWVRRSLSTAFAGLVIVAAAVGGERAGQTLCCKHLEQAAERRGRPFLLHQERRIDVCTKLLSGASRVRKNAPAPARHLRASRELMKIADTLSLPSFLTVESVLLKAWHDMSSLRRWRWR